jgi:hypothetical protein
MLQSALDDHISAVTHRGHRLFQCHWTLSLNLNDATSRLNETLDVGLFMLGPPLPEDLKHGIVEEGPLGAVVSRQTLKRHEMPASQEVRQIAGKEQWPAA